MALPALTIVGRDARGHYKEHVRHAHDKDRTKGTKYSVWTEKLGRSTGRVRLKFVTRSGGRKLERWKGGMEEKSVSANTVFFPSVSTSIVTCTGSVGTRVAFTHVARLLRDPLILPRKDASLRYRCVL